MVKDTRKTLHPDALKPVNVPELVTVKESPVGLPAALKIRRQQAVSTIEDSWRIDDEWWRQRATSRLYYAVRLDEGQRLVIYKDLVDGCWYRQSY